MSDTEEEDYKQYDYYCELRQDYETKVQYNNNIENASINVVENIRNYLDSRGSILYAKVNSVNFSNNFYNMIHEIINLKN